MSRVSQRVSRFFHVLTLGSAIVAAVCFGAGVWAARSGPTDHLFAVICDNGVPAFNQKIYGYRNGLDIRLSVTKPIRFGGIHIYDEAMNRIDVMGRPHADDEWGQPNYWLKLPAFEFSLWPPFAASVVLPLIRLVRPRRSTARGFPCDVRQPL